MKKFNSDIDDTLMTFCSKCGWIGTYEMTDHKCDHSGMWIYDICPKCLENGIETKIKFPPWRNFTIWIFLKILFSIEKNWR